MLSSQGRTENLPHRNEEAQGAVVQHPAGTAGMEIVVFAHTAEVPGYPTLYPMVSPPIAVVFKLPAVSTGAIET